MKLNYRLLGKRIREIRLRQNISQATLSELVDKTPTYISYIENGYKSMSLETLVAIANALKVSADTILADSLRYILQTEKAEISEVLNDCNPFERRIIVDSAKALKQSLQEYRFMLKKKSQ